MKNNDPKQRYTFLFRFQNDDRVRYATVAYTHDQAVKQLILKHPNNNIESHVRNHSFDVERIPYIPKEDKPTKPKKKKNDGYQQMGFKDFAAEPTNSFFDRG